MDVSRGPEPVYVLAGYIATVGHWNRFRTEWLRMLAEYDAPLFSPADLDLKDKNGNRIGLYKGWSDEKALAFQQRAFSIIKRRRRVAISSSILTDQMHLHFAWMKKKKDDRQEGLARFYVHATKAFLEHVRNWIKRYRVKDPIHYVFERGDEGYDEINSALGHIIKDPKQSALFNLASYTNANKKDHCFIQLQAAGIWAYEVYKHVANQFVTTPPIEPRASFKVLMRKYDEPFNTVYTKTDFDNLVEAYRKQGGTLLDPRTGTQIF